jgi:hypothetical protein
MKKIGSALVLAAVLTQTLIGRAAADAGSGPAKGGPCALLSAADAEKISGTPMRLATINISAKPDRMCNYEAVKGQKGVHAHVKLELHDDKDWKVVKSGISGKLETDGLQGIADEAYYTKSPAGRYTQDTLIFFVRKGNAKFSVYTSSLGLVPTAAMKAALKKLAGEM